MYKHSLLLAAAALSVSPVFGQASPNASQNLSNLPLSFEPNVGQTDSAVRFMARSKGMIVYFTDNEIVMSLNRREKGADGVSKANRHVIKMKMTNGRPPLQAQGLDPQGGVSNYYRGNDPKAWQTNVPHYGRVSLSGVYDGVDLVSYGNDQKLEYDFVVAPGADPKQVQLAFEGVDSMDVNAAGDLVLHTPIGDVLQKRPAVYQNSAQGRMNVAANYTISRGHRVAFELAAYDRKKPLIIDPVITYATYLSGSAYDDANAIAVDKYGAAYVTGWTNSSDFPHTTNTHIGSDDAFVIKVVPAVSPVGSFRWSIRPSLAGRSERSRQRHRRGPERERVHHRRHGRSQPADSQWLSEQICTGNHTRPGNGCVRGETFGPRHAGLRQLSGRLQRRQRIRHRGGCSRRRLRDGTYFLDQLPAHNRLVSDRTGRNQRPERCFRREDLAGRQSIDVLDLYSAAETPIMGAASPWMLPARPMLRDTPARPTFRSSPAASIPARRTATGPMRS